LRELDRWVCWRYEWRVNKQGEGKWIKLPVDPKTGRNARGNDPATWGTFRQAFSFYLDHQKDPNDSRVDGIGIEFFREAGSGQHLDLAGADVDDALDPKTGQIKPWAQRVIKKMNSYTELSPSGTGYKIFFFSHDFFAGKKQGTRLPYHDGTMELYVGGRFFAVTGHRLHTNLASVRKRPEHAKAVLGWLLAYQGKDEEPKLKPAPTPSVNGHSPINGDLNLFLGRLKNVRPSPHGYVARCPGHDDQTPSLSIGVGSDGKILLKCFAGCSIERIVSALGLSLTDLFPPNGKAGRKPFEPKHAEPKKPSGKAFPTAKEALVALNDMMARKHQGQRAGKWKYRDAEGNLVALVVRYNTPTDAGQKQAKTFRPVSKWPDGWHLCDPEEWPLYRLNELTDTDRVFVVEGEKCADVLWDMGISATTSAHGALSPHKSNWRLLAGKQVVIVPDDDDAGDNYAATVTEILSQLSPQPKVTIGQTLSAKE
jgi:hypothetical protein